MEPDVVSSIRRRLSPGAFVSLVLALVSGAVLRFWMLAKFFEVNGDSQLYGGMAKNLILCGRYAITLVDGEVHSTLIRLPGYPFFLAACFRLFGMENYFWPAVIQILLSLGACLLAAFTAARVSPDPMRSGAFHAALWLAALCPFTAVYDAEPLTESLSLFSIAVALWAVARFERRQSWMAALAFTCAVSYAALLRPDGALLGAALAVPMGLAQARSARADRARAERLAERWRRMLAANVRHTQWRIVLVCLLLALAPFALWTIRNARVFHVFQPLAPRYATDPGENSYPGFQRWVKTWMLDYVSTYQIYWNVPDAPLDITQLPRRAFDSPAEREETAQIFAAYEANGEDLNTALDARFERLADTRIRSHPMRYYVWLPLGRLVDMTFRPRVENLPIDLDWWVYSHHWVETRFSWFYTGLNAMYVLVGLAGFCLRPRLWRWMLLYIVMRSLLLCTVEAPEARYTLEFFPFLFVLGGAALARMFVGRAAGSADSASKVSA
jgi:hypothetical protein